MLKSKIQEHIVPSSGTTAQVEPADLSNFLNLCQTNGIKTDDFGAIMRSIANHVINGIRDDESVSKLKKLLLFLSFLEIFLSSIKVN
jgi:hypothetical protein